MASADTLCKKLPQDRQKQSVLFPSVLYFCRYGDILPSLTAKEAESPENTGFQPLFTHQKCSYILLLFSFLTGFLDA